MSFDPNPQRILYCNGCQYLIRSTSFVQHGDRNIQKQCQYSMQENEFKAATQDECPIPKNIELQAIRGTDYYIRPKECIGLMARLYT